MEEIYERLTKSFDFGDPLQWSAPPWEPFCLEAGAQTTPPFIPRPQHPFPEPLPPELLLPKERQKGPVPPKPFDVRAIVVEGGQKKPPPAPSSPHPHPHRMITGLSRGRGRVNSPPSRLELFQAMGGGHPPSHHPPFSVGGAVCENCSTIQGSLSFSQLSRSTGTNTSFRANYASSAPIPIPKGPTPLSQPLEVEVDDDAPYEQRGPKKKAPPAVVGADKRRRFFAKKQTNSAPGRYEGGGGGGGSGPSTGFPHYVLTTTRTS